ncbi:MAG TPA: hypothetical protein P5279_17955 [Anaerohalosphaeraceae bacterium]|nr:hypothetical protein [Anaerohalosphaeraceae bacterium]
MSIRQFIVLALLIVTAVTAIFWSLRRTGSCTTADAEPTVSGPGLLTPAEGNMLSAWSGDPEQAKVIRDICLEHSLSKKQIIELIGTPAYRHEADGTTSIGYSFAPSQVLCFYFDENDQVIHVEHPAITFLSHYDRKWNFIRAGMTKTEVNAELGYNQKELDGGRIWQFCGPGDPHLYDIYFDENGKVSKLDRHASHMTDHKQ